MKRICTFIETKKNSIRNDWKCKQFDDNKKQQTAILKYSLAD